MYVYVVSRIIAKLCRLILFFARGNETCCTDAAPLTAKLPGCGMPVPVQKLVKWKLGDQSSGVIKGCRKRTRLRPLRSVDCTVC